MSGSKWDSQPRAAARGRHDYSAEDALSLQQSAIRAEFNAQPPARQRETLDRALSLLVDELRRREAGQQRTPSALWKSMAAWGFTEHLVRLEAKHTNEGEHNHAELKNRMDGSHL